MIRDGLVKVEFVKDRGRRVKGDIASFDAVSAGNLVEEGAAKLFEPPAPEAPAAPKSKVDPKPAPDAP